MAVWAMRTSMIPIHSTAHAVAHVCRRDAGHQKRTGHRKHYNDGYAPSNRFHIVVHRADNVNIHLFNNIPDIIYEKASGFRGAMLHKNTMKPNHMKPSTMRSELKRLAGQASNNSAMTHEELKYMGRLVDECLIDESCTYHV
jgi:hypothetical protein